MRYKVILYLFENLWWIWITFEPSKRGCFNTQNVCQALLKNGCYTRKTQMHMTVVLKKQKIWRKNISLKHGHIVFKLYTINDIMQHAREGSLAAIFERMLWNVCVALNFCKVFWHKQVETSLIGQWCVPWLEIFYSYIWANKQTG